MFDVGDLIVYGMNGICRVTEVCKHPFDSGDERLYYLLIPVNNPTSSSIYTPVDNDRVQMRRLMTASEIEQLISSIPQIEPLSIPVEKKRRETYRDVLAELVPEGYIRVIKTIRKRKEELAAARKHFPITDLEYGRLAEHLLCSECAHVLGLAEANVGDYIEARLPKAE